MHALKRADAYIAQTPPPPPCTLASLTFNLSPAAIVLPLSVESGASREEKTYIEGVYAPSFSSLSSPCIAALAAAAAAAASTTCATRGMQ